MKKLILGIGLIVFIFLFAILFLVQKKFTQAQGSQLGIELYIYPRGFYEGGTIKIENAKDDIYKTSPFSTVVANTEYLLLLKGVGNTYFILNFTLERDSQGRPGPSYYRTDTCSNFGGTLINSNNDCQIEGTFQEPRALWELWKISLTKGNNTTSIRFYLVNQSFAQKSNIAFKDDQYYLEPTSTTTEPNSTITYQVYNNKLYCPSYITSGMSTTTPSPSSGSFNPFNVDPSKFGANISIPANLVLSNVPRGTYNLYLFNINTNQRISTPSNSIIVQKVASLPGSFKCKTDSKQWCRCLLSYCYWFDTSAGRWAPTSSAACGNLCTGGVRE